MPKFFPPRGQRRNVEPYDRTPQTRLARLWTINEKIKDLKTQLDIIKAREENWKAEYDLIDEMVEVMRKHVKRLLDGFEDRGEVGQTELLLRLQKMNLRK
ncbi:hypothetical protein FPOAC2_08771 [Fusarium poae]|jgi:hypothetical protein|uniref:hypothetical protein n=1 Tax=Fusarium poae TaxID=36050 RepID=UPI001CE727DE|nr:hypothetical protein FPOAC1_008837 [Fusarium poae]KAG8669442.1 hypothetical protein FPOAC1_008837 [Fusarium poae]